jgi:hypothetical protein
MESGWRRQEAASHSEGQLDLDQRLTNDMRQPNVNKRLYPRFTKI